MEYELLQEALRALFLIGAPLVVVTAVAGTIAAALMAATTIQEPALGYAVRLAAAAATLLALMPLAARCLMGLGEMALR